jgi:DNA-binding SARP family transcriptional activator/tetratricopeptide (TPR) repeat protein
VDYGLLGPLRVVDGDREIVLPRQKHRALLAFLLLHAGEVVSVDRLLDGLWGERPPETAKNSLQNNVSQLRKLLGADVLRTAPPGYVLDISDDDVDVRRFLRLVELAREQGAPERASTLQQALALWRGPALADLTFEPFALIEAPRLEELRSIAEEGLVAAELERGRHAELVPRIESLIGRNPLRERLRGQLMLALYRSGRQADALAAYQLARKTLVEELGIEPGPTLRALEQAILHHDSALRPPDASMGDATPRAADLRERRARVTVLFAEIVAPEDLDAERHRSATTHAFHELRAATEYHGGTVERLAGDELLAVFGVPERHEDDALRAVRAALQIQRAMRSFPQLETRVALETGEVMVPGTATHAPVTGEPILLAKRLAEAAPPGEIVAQRPTLDLVRAAVHAEPMAPVVVRGRSEPVPVFRIDGVRDETRRLRATRSPLVGRADELRVLRAAFDEVAATSRSAVFTVLGEAGLGKTRLAAELFKSLDRDIRAVVGRCVSYGTSATWQPLREIAQAAGVDLEGAAGSAIETLFGVGTTTADAFFAARRLLEAVALNGPSLVVLDDVHWAAPPLLEFIEQIARSPVDAPAFVLCLARPGLADARPHLGSLTLAPLSHLQVAALVDAAAADSVLAEPRTRIAELADGNPFFAEQLLAYVHEHGADALASVPPTVEALLASRLDRLDAEERGVLQRAAVVGREFWHAAVLHLSPPLELPSVGRHLSELVAKGLVFTATSTSEREDSLRFHHVLIRDVAYASIPKAERANLHEGVAEWLDAQGGADDALVGFHLEQAYRCRHDLAPKDPHTEAIAVAAGRRLAAAGLLAHRRGDSPAAADLLARATMLLPLADSVTRDLFCELAIAEWSLGDIERAAETLDRAIEAALKQQNRRAELRARIELANLRVFTEPEGGTEELLGLVEDALPLFEQHDDFRSLGRAWLHFGFVQGGVRRQNDAWRDATERALANYRRTGWSGATCVGDLASALLLGPTPARAARARCRELLAESGEDRLAAAHVQVALGGLEAMLGEFAEARRLIAEARAIYQDTGFALAVAGRADRSLGRIELLADRPEEAERVLRSCCEWLERAGERIALATTAAELAEALYRGGRHVEAVTWLDVSRRTAPPDDLGAQYRWRGVNAKVLAAAGDLAAAAELARGAVELTRQTDALNEQGEALLSLAEVLRFARETHDALSTAECALALFEQKENEAAAAQARRFVDEIAVLA